MILAYIKLFAVKLYIINFFYLFVFLYLFIFCQCSNTGTLQSVSYGTGWMNNTQLISLSVFLQKAKLGMKIWHSGLGTLVFMTLDTSSESTTKVWRWPTRELSDRINENDLQYVQTSDLWTFFLIVIFMFGHICLLCLPVALDDYWIQQNHEKMLLQGHQVQNIYSNHQHPLSMEPRFNW